jgi:hypothetical protein
MNDQLFTIAKLHGEELRREAALRRRAAEARRAERTQPTPPAGDIPDRKTVPAT